jgi:hypothetical protein
LLRHFGGFHPISSISREISSTRGVPRIEQSLDQFQPRMASPPYVQKPP